MSDNLIEKINKLMAQAEGTKNETEAAAYMAAAQRLATQHSIDLEIARTHAQSKLRKPVLTRETVRMGEHGTKGLYTYVNLICEIAHANGLRCAISRGSTMVYLYGYDTDIEVTKALYESLVVQMVTASKAFLATGAHREETVYDWRTGTDKPISGLTARLNFQNAFGDRIGGRLTQARREAQEQAKAQDHFHISTAESAAEAVTDTGDTSVALALVRKEQTVNDYYKSTSNARGSYRGGQKAGYSSSGHAAGRAAGDRARITASKAIGGSRTALA